MFLSRNQNPYLLGFSVAEVSSAGRMGALAERAKLSFMTLFQLCFYIRYPYTRTLLCYRNDDAIREE